GVFCRLLEIHLPAQKIVKPRKGESDEAVYRRFQNTLFHEPVSVSGVIFSGAARFREQVFGPYAIGGNGRENLSFCLRGIFPDFLVNVSPQMVIQFVKQRIINDRHPFTIKKKSKGLISESVAAGQLRK
ncbi:MAG: hypothetical protein ACI4UT_02590, partial [Candidatus Enteromonas sp.]